MKEMIENFRLSAEYNTLFNFLKGHEMLNSKGQLKNISNHIASYDVDTAFTTHELSVLSDDTPKEEMAVIDIMNMNGIKLIVYTIYYVDDKDQTIGRDVIFWDARATNGDEILN